uniref:Uncharacterized protein n=1 Tax=Setaria viridis TaxID=4556 RepID=A0A4U6VDL0_SETVI|nr:hypothetical protein SEVIR_3G264900v2 [Setaria viridis]
MVRPPRRLRNLNLEEEEDAEPIENGQDNLAENDNGHDNLVENKNDDDLQDPPDIDGLLAHLPYHHPQTPIKIIWPNGEVRQLLGGIRVSNIEDLDGGKVIVGTNENGVPNKRSTSILGQHLGQIAEKPSLAPLHIQRWDNALFNTHKQQIIKDVEVHFQLPRQTLNLTRGSVLHTVNNWWRSNKSKLKK